MVVAGTTDMRGIPSTPVTLTEAAVGKVAELIAREDSPSGERLALRIAVKSGGCSGYSYEMFFDSDVSWTNDIVTEFGDVRVVVDQDSAELLYGAVLDYKDGLHDRGFQISNPNATRTCKCGSSFH